MSVKCIESEHGKIIFIYCRSLIRRLYFIHTDTDNARSCENRHWRSRDMLYSKCIGIEHCKTTSLLSLIAHLLSLFPIDTQYAVSWWQPYRWPSSELFITRIASEQSEIILVSSIIHSLSHFIQGLKRLEMAENRITDIGAKYLAEALKVNTVERLPHNFDQSLPILIP